MITCMVLLIMWENTSKCTDITVDMTAFTHDISWPIALASVHYTSYIQ